MAGGIRGWRGGWVAGGWWVAGVAGGVGGWRGGWLEGWGVGGWRGEGARERDTEREREREATQTHTRFRFGCGSLRFAVVTVSCGSVRERFGSAFPVRFRDLPARV